MKQINSFKKITLIIKPKVIKMQVKSIVSTALLLGIVALSPAISNNEAAAAPSNSKKPYCTVASKQGSYWWTWTKSTVTKSCVTARSKVPSVDKLSRGYYFSNSINKGEVSCKQGSKQVIGTGKLVFENGINLASKLNWSSCTIKMI
jgi:hypothetical protein